MTDHPEDPFAAFCDWLFCFIAARPVIDMRFNGGGDTFLGRPLLHHVIGCLAINQRGALFVIIGRQTFSAAQNVATVLERHTNATFIGQPTGSRPNFIGEGIAFELPVSKPAYLRSLQPEPRPALTAVHALTEHLPGS